MFSVMDMVTGRSSEWRTHVEGGVSLLPTVDGKIWNSDKSTSMIYQSYLAVATLCNIELPPAIAVESEGCRCYVLDTLFGLTRPILQYIIKLNSLLSRTAAGDMDTELLNQLEEETRQSSPETISLGSMVDPLARNWRAITRLSFTMLVASISKGSCATPPRSSFRISLPKPSNTSRRLSG
jgi:hypothetical protein